VLCSQVNCSSSKRKIIIMSQNAGSPPFAAAHNAGQAVAERYALEDLERAYATMKQERNQARSALVELQEQLSKSEQTVAEQQRAQALVRDKQADLVALQQRVQSLQAELIAADERKDRLEHEADLLREEIRYVCTVTANAYVFIRSSS
jgi:chromosome segregation ATPase